MRTMMWFLSAWSCQSAPVDPTAPPPPPPPGPQCGDAALDPGEACDHGAANADDAECTSACTEARCGDGLVWADEEACDDGPANADDAACLLDCEPARCGDGFVWEGVEDCDYAPRSPGCSPQCTTPDTRSISTADLFVDGDPKLGDAGLLVAPAGDVNGDGRADLIVRNASATMPTVAFLVHGQASGVVEVAKAAARFEGLRSTGYFLRGVGDLNDDGFDDLALADPTEGVVYVVYGPVTGTVDLLTVADRIVGPDMWLGARLAPAGDVDGDGFGDLWVSAPQHDTGGTDAGSVFLIHGPVLGEVVATDAATQVRGAAAGDVAGYGLLGEHDLTGDGVADLVVASMFADTTIDDVGIVTVVPGPVDGIVELADVGTRVLGADPGGALGWGLAAGDVTGDGQADLVIGAFTADPGGQSGAGKAFVVEGPVVGEVDLATDALATIGATGPQHYLGASAAVADLNGDGVGDIVLGAYGADTNRGAVHVLYGPPEGVILADNAPLTYVGDQERDQIGYTLAQAGDVNGDGANDVAISTRDWDQGGGAWVVFGVP